jgi:hypothetical protein
MHTGGLTFKMHGQVGILWLTLFNSINKSLKLLFKKILITLLPYYQILWNKTTRFYFHFIFYQSGFSQGNKSIQGQVYFDKTLNKVEVINATAKQITFDRCWRKVYHYIKLNDQLVLLLKNHEIKKKISAVRINQGDIKISLSKVEELKK